MSKRPPRPNVYGGQFYENRDGRRMRPCPDDGRTPDAWICRRVVDFPRGEVPPGGELDTCSMCSALIVWNPARKVNAPKICMQCGGIRPLPIPE